LGTELKDKTRHRESRRVALVTGATGVIGKAIARRIASRHEYEVVLLCRDAAKAEAALADIQRRTGNPRVRYALVDLARQASIAALAARWAGPVHILVNNAAVAPRRREETPEGIERQFATNVLGYFRMIRGFTEHLAESAPARVVNVASYWAGGLDLEDLEFERRRYDNDAAYRQSKQADRMLTAAFAERLKDAGVTVNACHPGDAVSTLSRDLGFGGHETPDQAAITPAWLATEAIGAVATGHYFEGQRETKCPFGADRNAVEALYRACEGYG
jgi:NAD(P)-dependent dehydrogenase (short-subunit alcohol dehydrogenase family)